MSRKKGLVEKWSEFVAEKITADEDISLIIGKLDEIEKLKREARELESKILKLENQKKARKLYEMSKNASK